METQKNFKKVVLPNGLTVLLYKMEGVMSASAVLYVHAGAVFEKEEDRGISHLIEHVAFIGTKKFPTSIEVSNFAENLGILNGASTGKDVTFYNIKAPSINFNKGLEFLNELVFNPTLDDHEVPKEKEIILSEFNDFWNNPERKFEHIMWEKRFPKSNHPYSRRPMGIPETIKNLDINKVKVCRSEYYNPSNMILSIAGNFDSDVESVIENLFDGQEKGTKKEEPKFNQSEYSDFVLYHQEDKRPQISFYLSFPAFGSHEIDRRERLKLGLLSIILGSTRSSRLFTKIREKEKLVYRISSGFNLLSWLGAFIINGSTPIEKLTKALNTIKDEIENLTENGITESELALAKNFRIAQVMMSFDNPGDVARYYGEQVFDDEKIWSPEEKVKEIEKITKLEIDSLAIKIFDFSKVNVGLLGNVSPKILSEVQKAFKK